MVGDRVRRQIEQCLRRRRVGVHTVCMVSRRVSMVVAEAVEPEAADDRIYRFVRGRVASRVALPSVGDPQRLLYPIGDDLCGQWPVQRRRGPPIDFHRAPGRWRLPGRRCQRQRSGIREHRGR
jgi:hypothetical protein